MDLVELGGTTPVKELLPKMIRLAKASWLPGLALTFAIGVGATGCKQGEGDVCQIDDDCKSGLVCNPGTMRCQTPGAGVPDAGPVFDGGTFDAPETPDAGVDAIGIDADGPPDADGTPDA